jgi:acetyl-CoA synthetase
MLWYPCPSMSAVVSNVTIDHVLEEHRLFEPSKSFSKHAHVKSLEEYQRLYDQSINDPETFWANAGWLHWFKKWKRVLNDDNPPFYKWFEGGQAQRLLQLPGPPPDTWRKNKAAIIWEGEPTATAHAHLSELHREVCKFANVLRKQGHRKGDRVAIYLPMIPELADCHAGLCAHRRHPLGGLRRLQRRALATASTTLQAKVVITADGGYRRGNIIPLKPPSTRRCSTARRSRSVVVVQRTRSGPDGPRPRPLVAREPWSRPRQVRGRGDRRRAPAVHPVHLRVHREAQGRAAHHRRLPARCSPRHKYVFDLKDEDVYWCTADIGWVTGHSYIVYGPWPTAPHGDVRGRARLSRRRPLLGDHREVQGEHLLHRAHRHPRLHAKWGDGWPAKYDLSSLRLLGTVGEPINPEAWMWYHKHIGGERCPSSTPGGRPRPAPS